MHDGLNIVHTPSGWSPYVIIAWCRVRDGIVEYAPGYRVLRRFGSEAQVAQLAANGPAETTQLLDPAPLAGGCSTAMVSRFDEANPEAWVKEMPKPEGWDESKGA